MHATAGSSENSCQMHLEAIHRVRTAFGDSDLSYGGSGWIKPLHGIGHGNGGGPPIWAVISSTLLDILCSKGLGLKMISPITLMLLEFVGYSFVDDTDIVQSDGSTAASTIQKLQDAVDTWEGCLKITGGALGPEKSSGTLYPLNGLEGDGHMSPRQTHQLPYS
jgi:hypothetical protein